MKAKTFPLWVKLSPLAVLAGAVAVAALAVYVFEAGKVADAHDGHPGLSFSLAAANASTSTATPGAGTPTATPIPAACNTSGGNPNCSFALNQTFQVRVFLNSLPTGVTGYEGFDVQLNYSGVNFVTNTTSPDAGSPPTVGGNWPNCVFEAAGIGTGVVLVGCSIGISAPVSSYTGRIATFDFQCPGVNGFGSITMIHDTNGATSLLENPSTKHSEGTSPGTPGAPESLSITCGTPPTATRTPTPTPTKTNTPTITNTPTNTPTPTISPTPSNTPTATPLPSDQADVTLTKTDSPDPVAAGGTITYSLLVKNIGQQTATGIIVSDFLPPEVTFVSVSSAGANCNHSGGSPGGQVNCTIIGSLVQDAQVKISIDVTAHSPEEDEHITNLASVLASNEPFFNQGNNNELEQTVVLSPRPDIELTKVDLSDPVVSGGSLVYSLTVDNLGPEPAEDVQIRDNLPAGAVYNDAGSSIECDPGGGGPDPDVITVDVVCDLGTVAGSAAVQIAITVPTITQDAVLVNIAYASASNELFQTTGNNLDGEFTAALAPDPDLTVVKSGPVHVKRVQKFAYTLTVTNIGLGDAFNVQVTDTLPQHSINSINQPMTLQSVTGPASCGAVVNQVFTCTISQLNANGGQVVLTVNVRAPTVLTTMNLQNQSVVADPDEPGEPIGNNSGNATTEIRACFDVANNDNLVRIHDILGVLSHYFAEPPSPLYDLLYDIDGSGRVTVQDILLVVQHYFDDAPCVK
jgi:uncharacterized repeat protein (TIGR01451 family)